MPSDLSGEASQINDVLTLLIGQREEKFFREREVRFFQLQTLIYFPIHVPQILRTASIFVARKYLWRLENRVLRTTPDDKGLSSGYAKLFTNRKYSELFDATVGLRGNNRRFGWHRLIDEDSPALFVERAKIQARNAEPVVRMIELMFRQLSHEERDSEIGIKRAQVYVWKDNERPPDQRLLRRPLSGRTIRQRWSEFKATSILLYVDQTHFDGIFFPLNPASRGFVPRIEAECRDISRIRAFAETCQYVGLKLSPIVSPDLWPFHFGASPGPDFNPPKTIPLTDAERRYLADFKSDASTFDNS